MTPRRVALVTTDLTAVDDVDHDLARIVDALATEGVDAVPVRWRDAPLPAGVFDLAVIRSPWDYPEHLAAFDDWMTAASGHTPFANCPAIIRWNLDKHYLRRLDAAGVAIVPTTFCADVAHVTAAVAATDAARVVVKPHVSIGSRDTGLFDRDDPGALILAEAIVAGGRTVLVQPAIERVAEVGEHALVCFDGVFSHAFTKGPILRPGGGFLGGRYTETITPATADAAEIALAEQAGAVIGSAVDHERCGRGCGDAPPLYARFDVVAGPDGPLLLEAELFEPAFFLTVDTGAPARFAAAVVDRLDRVTPG